jgi:hypothetical protein
VALARRLCGDRRTAIASVWESLTDAQAKANLEQINAASQLIFARLMNLATPEEREALNLLMAEARTSVLYLEEAHKWQRPAKSA